MKQRNLAGTLFASPWLVGFALLVAWPFAASIYWSFTYFDLINPPRAAGTAQYQRLASEWPPTTSGGF